ncbi:MAG: ornithine carbamoyltransferase [Elusimicrobia bacterium]|jgi:ornithine carbamoyltransferase|nr:ornithine carbamoyltransferase [Elusimicrobiota bacterium]
MEGKSKYFGKDLITTQDWSREELLEAIELAEEMQKKRFSPEFTGTLDYKSFLMFFYNSSVRTRQSFEIAATELGGHALFLEPSAMRLKTKDSAGEIVEDAAGVMSRYGVGLGIRILEDKIAEYGQGDALLREYAKYSDIPIISMAHDRFHPCQGLADVMGYRKHLGKDLKGKTITHVWGHGALSRSHCSVQESMLINSRMGMNVRVAHPKGYELDEEVIEWTKKNCAENGTEFELSNDPAETYDNADVVYSRNWMSTEAYSGGEFQKQDEIKKALKYTDWICDEEKMKRSNNGLFSHPMPVDRGHEVTDEVASGDRSIILDIAENRLHVQKAVMALTMGE